MSVKVYAWNEDGSITVIPTFVPTPSFLDVFVQDKDKLYVWWPKFEPCISRELHTKRLECGKLTVRFHCKLLNESCSTISCDGCTKRVAPSDYKK